MNLCKTVALYHQWVNEKKHGFIWLMCNKAGNVRPTTYCNVYVLVNLVSSKLANVFLKPQGLTVQATHKYVWAVSVMAARSISWESTWPAFDPFVNCSHSDGRCFQMLVHWRPHDWGSAEDVSSSNMRHTLTNQPDETVIVWPFHVHSTVLRCSFPLTGTKVLFLCGLL